MSSSAPNDTPDPTTRAPRRTHEEKTRDILRYMADECNRFSFRQLMETLFKSEDPDLKKSASLFLMTGEPCLVLDLWVLQISNDDLEDWIMKKAGEICGKEF